MRRSLCSSCSGLVCPRSPLPVKSTPLAAGHPSPRLSPFAVFRFRFRSSAIIFRCESYVGKCRGFFCFWMCIFVLKNVSVSVSMSVNVSKLNINARTCSIIWLFLCFYSLYWLIDTFDLLIHWHIDSIDSLIDCLTDPVDLLIHRLINSIDSLTHWLIVTLTDCLTDSIESLTHWLIEPLTHWLHWFIDTLIPSIHRRH